VVRNNGENSNLSWVRSKFLANLGDMALQELLNAAQVRRFAPKVQVIASGGQPEHLFLLKSGRARSYILTEDGHEMVLLWAAPGEVLGLVSLLPTPPTYMVNTAAVSTCEFLVWDHATIRKLAAEHPAIMQNGFRVALYHIQTYMTRHINIVTKSAEARLADQLIKLATSAGEVGESGITIDITNEQLSSLSDISYFTTSRILSKWEQRGILSKRRGRIVVFDPESLMVTVDGA
jgi:CRP/FNR family transcriptional regulator, nitrogen oxide reductase regulator